MRKKKKLKKKDNPAIKIAGGFVTGMAVAGIAAYLLSKKREDEKKESNKKRKSG